MTVFQKSIQIYSTAVGENINVKGTPLFAGQMKGVEAAELIAPNQLWWCGLGRCLVYLTPIFLYVNETCNF